TATTVQVNADIVVTKTDGKTDAVPGTSDTYTITVQNNGPSAVVATSEIQTISLSGNTGTFTLTFNGFTTPTNTPLDASSATLGSDIQNALNSLQSIGGVGGAVTVSPLGSGTAFTVTFGGALANQNVSS